MILLIALLFGISSKYADLLNEHGLKAPFKGAAMMGGMIWGSLGMLLIYLDPKVAIFYTGILLYWFYKMKLDYTNHSLAGVMMLMASFAFRALDIKEHFFEMVSITFSYMVTAYIQFYYLSHYPKTSWFWRLRFRFYLIPLVYSLIVANPYPFFTTCLAMLGVEMTTFAYKLSLRNMPSISKGPKPMRVKPIQMLPVTSDE